MALSGVKVLELEGEPETLESSVGFIPFFSKYFWVSLGVSDPCPTNSHMLICLLLERILVSIFTIKGQG